MGRISGCQLYIEFKTRYIESLTQYIEFRTQYIEITTRYIEFTIRYELTTQYVLSSQLDILIL